MRRLVAVTGIVALGLSIVPAIAYVAGAMSLDGNKALMNVGAVLWFASVVVASRLK